MRVRVQWQCEHRDIQGHRDAVCRDAQSLRYGQFLEEVILHPEFGNLRQYLGQDADRTFVRQLYCESCFVPIFKRGDHVQETFNFDLLVCGPWFGGFPISPGWRIGKQWPI